MGKGYEARRDADGLTNRGDSFQGEGLQHRARVGFEPAQCFPTEGGEIFSVKLKKTPAPDEAADDGERDAEEDAAPWRG